MNTPIKPYLYRRFDSLLKVAVSRYDDSEGVDQVCWKNVERKNVEGGKWRKEKYRK